MSPITVGILLLGIGFIITLAILIYNGIRFKNYIRHQYPTQWDDMVNENAVGKALFPFRKGTITYFMLRSKETFGDKRISDLRKKLHQCVLAVFVIYPLAFVSYVVLIIFFLERRGMSGV